MAIQILSDEQRRQYASFTGIPSSDELARYFHLDEVDQENIRTLRGGHNRLGFALTLCVARFIGVFPDRDMDIPSAVLVRLRKQIDVEPAETLASRTTPCHESGFWLASRGKGISVALSWKYLCTKSNANITLIGLPI